MSAREDRTPEDWRDDLLEAALVHIPFEGWHRKAIVHGATDLGLDEAFAGLVFPGGPIEMLDYWMARADEQMTAELERRGIGQMRIRERITMAVRVRLDGPPRDAPAEVWLAAYEPGRVTMEIEAGSNAGLDMPHFNMVRDLTGLPDWTGGPYTAEGEAACPPELACAVLVQAFRGGPVLGAAAIAPARAD